MAKENDEAMSLYQDVMKTFRQVMNTESPNDDSTQSPKDESTQSPKDESTQSPIDESTQSPKDESTQSTSLSTMSTVSSHVKKGLPNLLSLSKRKISLGVLDLYQFKRQRTESSSSLSLSPPPPSLWEIKKMKIDLIAAKAEITMLEARVKHYVTLKQEMQVNFDEEKVSFMDQRKRDERAVRDSDDRLNVLKRRHKEAIEDLDEAKKEYNAYKEKWETEKSGLQKQIADLKDQMLELNVSNRDEIAEMRRDMDEILQGLESAHSEVDILKKELERQTSRAEQFTAQRTQIEKQGLELQLTNNKLRELQYEKDMYQDWQQHSKTAQNRLTNMAALEKEVERLRANERKCRENFDNRLLMEEQMNQLKDQLDALQPAHQELCDTKVKLYTAESALSEWEIAGRGHGLKSPRNLSAALDAALTNQLTAVAGQSQAQSKLAQVTEEMATMRYERDKASALLDDLQTIRTTHDSLINRLQKRLALVSRERDNYSEQLECYEKELSRSLGDASRTGPVALLTARVEQLEQTVKEYHELQKLTDQPAHTAMVDGLRVEVTRWRDQAEQQRRDAAKLRTQRDHLQGQLERLTAQDPWTQIIREGDNPNDLALKQAQGDLEAAKEEITILKKALNDGGSRVCPDEFKQLKQQLESCQIKMQSMKDEFTSSAQEYSDVCYMLLGYRLERTADKNYKIASVYADSSEEYLLFNICEGGVEMVHTEYSATLVELVEMHLQQQRSIPLFHSALTMQLFFKTTPMQQDNMAAE